MREYLVENARLRQLSRQHAEERLTGEAYRAARRAIIEALEDGRVEAGSAADSLAVTGSTRAPGTATRQPQDAAVFYKTMPPQAAGPEIRDDAAAVWDDNTQVLALVLVLSLLIALGALVYVFVL